MSDVVDMGSNHPTLVEAVERMLIDVKFELPFYGEFNLNINFRDSTKKMRTCATNVKSTGMYFYYNADFLSSLNTVDGEISGVGEEEIKFNKWERQKQVNFLLLHNNYHLLFNHPQRMIAGNFKPSFANIAQDMIINSTLWGDITQEFISVPKYPDNKENRASDVANKHMALFIPRKYVEQDGDAIFEELYSWLREEHMRWDNNRKQNSDQPNTDPMYGDYGVYGENNTSVNMFSLDYIFSQLDENEGSFMDEHMDDTVPEEVRENFVNDVIEGLRGRGLVKGDIETTLDKLRKKRKDYLREIKRCISNDILGNIKKKSLSKPNRRGIKGLKGNKKIKAEINVILDTSGSMGGLFEKVLSYVFQRDITINMFQVDTEVHGVKKITSMREMQHIDIQGLGGTMLQPGIDMLTEKGSEYQNYNTVILTDGYCDTLDLSKVNGRVLGITTGCAIPMSNKPKNGFYKEITVDESY